jgi:hypothetical protein
MWTQYQVHHVARVAAQAPLHVLQVPISTMKGSPGVLPTTSCCKETVCSNAVLLTHTVSFVLPGPPHVLSSTMTPRLLQG